MILDNKGADMTSNPDSTSRASGQRRTSEITLNEWVAQWLNERSERPWEASAEELDAIEGRGKLPDLIVREMGRRPVIAELEFGSPAVADATRRIGVQVTRGGRRVYEVLAVGYDEVCRSDDRERFFKRLDEQQDVLTVQTVSRSNGDNGHVQVWPPKPLSATSEDLIAYIEYLQIPQELVDSTFRFARSHRSQSRWFLWIRAVRLVSHRRFPPTSECCRTDGLRPS